MSDNRNKTVWVATRIDNGESERYLIGVYSERDRAIERFSGNDDVYLDGSMVELNEYLPDSSTYDSQFTGETVRIWENDVEFWMNGIMQERHDRRTGENLPIFPILDRREMLRVMSLHGVQQVLLRFGWDNEAKVCVERGSAAEFEADIQLKTFYVAYHSPRTILEWATEAQGLVLLMWTGPEISEEKEK